MLPILRSQSNASYEILPQGEDGQRKRSQGRPRRQFHLQALVVLLTLAAVLLGLGRWLGLGVPELLLLTGLLVVLWWRFAEIVDPPEREETDQEPLREEVRQWQTHTSGVAGAKRSAAPDAENTGASLRSNPSHPACSAER